MTDSLNIVVLYHANCWDGLAAAWVVEKGLRERCPFKVEPSQKTVVRTEAVQYGQPLPDIPDDAYVFIVDFSYDRETLVSLNKRVKRLVVLDHHVTAQKQLEGLDFCIFDMDKSGARLAWEYFFKEGEDAPPLWLQYIEDRDLWKWELDYSQEFSAYLSSLPMTTETLDDLHEAEPKWIRSRSDRYMWDSEPVRSGEAILSWQKVQVEAVAKDAVEWDFDGTPVYAVNSILLYSEVGHQIVKMNDGIAAVYRVLPSGDVKISLRSKEETDVSNLAYRFGGGGHKNAASFVISGEEFLRLTHEGCLKSKEAVVEEGESKA